MSYKYIIIKIITYTLPRSINLSIDLNCKCTKGIRHLNCNKILTLHINWYNKVYTE